MRPQQVLPFQVRVNLEVIAIKGNSTLSRASELEPHHLMNLVLYLGHPLFGGMYYFLQGIEAVYFKASQKGMCKAKTFCRIP